MPITYPRPTGPNDRYDAYRISTTTAERENIPYPSADGQEPPGLDPDVVLCLRVQNADPLFDPATEKLVQDAPVYDTDNGTVTRGRSVQALTAQEIADRDAAVHTALTDEVDATLVAAGAQGVRIRALIELLNKRDNYLVNRIAELQSTLLALQSSNGNAGTRLDALPTAYLPTATRTKSAAIQDYKDDINAGNQNNP